MKNAHMLRDSASQAWKMLAEAQGSWTAKAKQEVRERDRGESYFDLGCLPCHALELRL